MTYEVINFVRLAGDLLSSSLFDARIEPELKSIKMYDCAATEGASGVKKRGSSAFTLDINRIKRADFKSIFRRFNFIELYLLIV
jgi:hypothetical protein